LRKLVNERISLIEMLRPLIDGLYEREAPGVAHNFLQLKREAIVLAEMVELVSLLVPHEEAVRAVASDSDR
jgi:hypothetical protein